ncbi:MAG: polyprenyl synthetase family protein [Rikenellaceae bacterium]|jgi:octaprenyl-diphosphate synthase|nr:polyprenyl synthetase family protein [Rikenellaceae bacterium]
MNILDEIRRPIATDIEGYNQFLARQMSSDNSYVEGILSYIFENGGKGVRLMLVLLTAGLHSRTPEGGAGLRTYLAALLVEMMHTASLVHDDVIDESDLRRGKPSVRAMFNSRNAVLTGDFILAKSMTLGLDSAQYDIVSYVVRAMSELCEGELIQSEHSRRLEMTRDTYLEIIHKKTATLFGVSAGVGALSVGAPAEDVARMRLFGENLGMAFQIRDDILDYDTAGDTGKPACNDLAEQKITLPLLAVLGRSTPERKVELLARLADVSKEPSNIGYLRDVVVAEGGIADAEGIMRAYISRAQSLLATYPTSSTNHPASPYHTSLALLATYSADRKK